MRSQRPPSVFLDRCGKNQRQTQCVVLRLGERETLAVGRRREKVALLQPREGQAPQVTSNALFNSLNQALFTSVSLWDAKPRIEENSPSSPNAFAAIAIAIAAR